MEDVSVSKGVFAYAPRKVGQKKKKSQCDSYINEPWYKAFEETWSAIENAATTVNTYAFKQILSDLENFVNKVKNVYTLEGEIPTGILLAGVNLPDHNLLVHKLVLQLQSVTPYIATVWSRDAGTLKGLTEEIVYQIINESRQEDDLLEVKKSQCTFCTLHAWYKENNNNNTPLVIIIPDFESFSCRVLHDFILILSSYWKSMKFVLIFGVATTLHVVHRSLSYDATSKLKIQVFHTQTQVQSLSDLLEGIVLSPGIPFKLTGRAFKLLIDIFLWYDFSVNGYLQSYKVCMWRHFYGQNEKLICCNKEVVNNRVSCLTAKDLRQLRKLASVKKYLQSLNKTEMDDNEFKEILIDLLNKFHLYINNFLIILKCLYKLTDNLPGHPFGKTFREIYANAAGNISLCETSEYKQAIQLIGFLSKEELLLKIKSILLILSNYELTSEDVVNKLKYHMDTIKHASLDVEAPTPEIEIQSGNLNRLQFREKLKQASLKIRRSPYKEAQIGFIEYLDKHVFMQYLKNPTQVPIHEIFCYDDINTVNNCIRGSMKAAIYNGLNDPNHFLRCDCCVSENEILSTHPDLCIVYKLHLESRKMINMYDWLQSFVAMVDRNGESNEEQDVDPILYDRFTRAVAELQFLGFIKTTRKKTDHVKRLT